MSISNSDSLLPARWSPQVERIGFVLSDGSVVEVENSSSSPDAVAAITAEDLALYEGTAVATWHTHPKGTCNLSVADFETFLSWPQYRHYVIGTDGVACYEVSASGKLLRCE